MSVKIKAGTCFVLPVTIKDAHFSDIEAIEFLFKQTEDRDAETIKTAYWSKDGECRDVEQIEGENTFLVMFSVDESYLFQQGEMFFLDTRIHHENSMTNPYTNIVRVTMSNTLFAQGEEVGP